jgi:hypothetical protein
MVKVQALTDKLNALVEAFNKHTHPGVITAAAGGQRGGSGAPAVGTPVAQHADAAA